LVCCVFAYCVCILEGCCTRQSDGPLCCIRAHLHHLFFHLLTPYSSTCTPPLSLASSSTRFASHLIASHRIALHTSPLQVSEGPFGGRQRHRAARVGGGAEPGKGRSLSGSSSSAVLLCSPAAVLACCCAAACSLYLSLLCLRQGVQAPKKLGKSGRCCMFYFSALAAHISNSFAHLAHFASHSVATASEAAGAAGPGRRGQEVEEGERQTGGCSGLLLARCCPVDFCFCWRWRWS